MGVSGAEAAAVIRRSMELPRAGRTAPDFLRSHHHGGTNFSGYSNPTVDRALDQAAQTSDPAARAKLLLDAETQLAKDLPSIPIVQPRAIVFQSNQLAGAPLTFSYMTSPWAAAIGPICWAWKTTACSS